MPSGTSWLPLERIGEAEADEVRAWLERTAILLDDPVDLPRGQRSSRDPGDDYLLALAARVLAQDADAPGEPGGDAADEAAAADCHKQRVELRRLLLELQADRALAEQRQRMVIGVNGKGTAASS